MKLLSCHVENFGKLHNYDMDFSSDFQTICEDNGFGKSTLAAFLRIMFYGFLGEAKRNGLENERKRYQSWQGGAYGGTVSFEVNGKQYRMTRVFADKAQNDEFELRELSTNLISSDFTEKIGEELFSVNQESFMRTVFIGQNDLVTNVTDDIQAKIGNLTENTNDLNSFEIADKRLTDYINGLSPRRKTGAVYKLKESEAAVQTEIRALDGMDEAIDKQKEYMDKTRAEIEIVKADMEAIAEKQTLLSRQQDVLSKKELYEHLCGEQRKKEKELQEIEAAYTDTIPKKEELNHITDIWNERNMRKNTLQMKESNYEFMLRQYEEQCAEKEQKRKNQSLYMLIAGIVLVLLGIVTAVFIIGIFLLIAGIVLIVISRKKKRQNEESVMPPELSKLETDIAEDKEFICDAESRVKAYLLAGGRDVSSDSYAKALDDWKERIAETEALLKNKREDLESAKQKKERFESEHDIAAIMQALPQSDAPNLEELNRKYKEKSEELERLRRTVHEYEKRLDGLREQSDSLEDKQKKSEDLQAEIADKTQLYNRLQLVQELMRQAKESLTQKYVAPLKNSFTRYYEILTDGQKTDAYYMDANANITVDEQGMQRETEYLSAGYQDLIGLCLRLSFADAMYPDEKPMLILDDPLVNLDEDKIEGGKRLLREAAKKYQIIYFTCHGSRC